MSCTEYQFSDSCQSRLRVAYYYLRQLSKSIWKTPEEGSEENSAEAPSDPEMFRQQLDATLSMLELALDMPKSVRFSHWTFEDLSRLNIRPAGYLSLKSDCRERLNATISLGEDELWTSPNLYRHLQSLENQIPRRTVGSERAWIEAFFFRVSAMLNNRRMIINNESDGGSRLIYWRAVTLQGRTSPISGSADYYTAVLPVDSAPHTYEALFTMPGVHILHIGVPQIEQSGLLTIVGGDSLDPYKQVPRAILEMYTCGMHCNLPKILRGVLTNGRQWIFLLIKFDEEYNSALYMQSEVIRLMVTRDLRGDVAIHGPSPDLIAAILAYWIENGSEDLGRDDWFETVACIPTL